MEWKHPKMDIPRIACVVVEIDEPCGKKKDFIQI